MMFLINIMMVVLMLMVFLVREVSSAMLEEKGGELTEEVQRRVRLDLIKFSYKVSLQKLHLLDRKRKIKQIPNRHVVTEIPRTEEAASALEKVGNAYCVLCGKRMMNLVVIV